MLAQWTSCMCFHGSLSHYNFLDESGDVVSMQKLGAQVLSGCVFLEYFLGYTKVTYEACGYPGM